VSRTTAARLPRPGAPRRPTPAHADGKRASHPGTDAPARAAGPAQRKTKAKIKGQRKKAAPIGVG
jgi:hypothetical protein